MTKRTALLGLCMNVWVACRPTPPAPPEVPVIDIPHQARGSKRGLPAADRCNVPVLLKVIAQDCCPKACATWQSEIDNVDAGGEYERYFNGEALGNAEHKRCAGDIFTEARCTVRDLDRAIEDGQLEGNDDGKAVLVCPPCNIKKDFP